MYRESIREFFPNAISEMDALRKRLTEGFLNPIEAKDYFSLAAMKILSDLDKDTYEQSMVIALQREVKEIGTKIYLDYVEHCLQKLEKVAEAGYIEDKRNSSFWDLQNARAAIRKVEKMKEINSSTITDWKKKYHIAKTKLMQNNIYFPKKELKNLKKDLQILEESINNSIENTPASLRVKIEFINEKIEDLEWDKSFDSNTLQKLKYALAALVTKMTKVFPERAILDPHSIPEAGGVRADYAYEILQAMHNVREEFETITCK